MEFWKAGTPVFSRYFHKNVSLYPTLQESFLLLTLLSGHFSINTSPLFLYLTVFFPVFRQKICILFYNPSPKILLHLIQNFQVSAVGNLVQVILCWVTAHLATQAVTLKDFRQWCLSTVTLADLCFPSWRIKMCSHLWYLGSSRGQEELQTLKNCLLMDDSVATKGNVRHQANQYLDLVKATL